MLDQHPPRLATGSLRSGTITPFIPILGVRIVALFNSHRRRGFMMNGCMNAEL